RGVFGAGRLRGGDPAGAPAPGDRSHRGRGGGADRVHRQRGGRPVPDPGRAQDRFCRPGRRRAARPHRRVHVTGGAAGSGGGGGGGGGGGPPGGGGGCGGGGGRGGGGRAPGGGARCG